MPEPAKVEKKEDEKMDVDPKPSTAKDKDKKDKEPEMTEEDKKLQEELNMLVERLSENDQSLYRQALESMRSLIRSSTQSMTSVPKPLKYMRPHYETMKEVHTKIKDSDTQRFCSDIVSVLAMTSDDSAGNNDCIHYRLTGNAEPIGDWGLEYVRHLCLEMAEEWRKVAVELGENKENVTPDLEKKQKQLEQLASDIVQHHMKHNAETEACDLLMEIERLDILTKFVDKDTQPRVCLYLLSCVSFLPSPENTTLIKFAMQLCRQFERNIEALRCAIMLNDMSAIKDVFVAETNRLVQKQMALLLGRQHIFPEFTDWDLEGDVDALTALNTNQDLYQYFRSLARELDIMEPKTPEDIYKTHLEPQRAFGALPAAPDSSKMNLASAFVNGFVNCGFGKDKMVTASSEDANKWFYKNKDYGMLSAAASQGMIMRWDIDSGLTQCDKFLYANDEYIKAGTMLAIGIITCGVNDPSDPAGALLLDYVHSDSTTMRIGSTFGLGLAYVNSKRPSVWAEADDSALSELRKVLQDTKPSATPEVKGVAALSLGLICVGTADSTVAMTILSYLLELDEEQLKNSNTRFMALALALIFLGTQEAAEAFIETVRTLPEPFGGMTAILIDVCAYAATGNVLKIQSMLHICSEHFENKEDDKATGSTSTGAGSSAAPKSSATDSSKKPEQSIQQAVAALGIGLIAMGEEIGEQMCLRQFGHLIRYGEPAIRQAVPLALALLSVSNPQLQILETLSKFSHDADADTARNAIFALGLVGAGTNNARLGTMLRQLAVYHQKDPQSLMLVRIAQGLTHLGKGTLTLNPFHSDRQLMNTAAVAGLIACCFTFLDAKNSVLNGRQHYLLYTLTPAMQPRMLITTVVDETQPDQLAQVNVPVRVGQAVDAVGQAGKPKTITGFRTHNTPVLLAFGERAELANEDYSCLSPHLEGIVILEKNAEADEKK